MKTTLSALAIACFGLIATPCMAKDKVKLARVKRNADGTITELKEVDKQTIIRETLHEKANGERVVSSKATYIIDKQDRARSCIIADGKGNRIFKVLYGYHKSNGRLIAESMFDLRVKRLNQNGQEIPVQRLYYKYDAHGNRSKPYAITSQGGKEVHKTQGWDKHIQERLDKIRFNNDTDGPTSISKDNMKKLR